jgi:hypothetical protein
MLESIIKTVDQLKDAFNSLSANSDLIKDHQFTSNLISLLKKGVRDFLPKDSSFNYVIDDTVEKLKKPAPKEDKSASENLVNLVLQLLEFLVRFLLKLFGINLPNNQTPEQMGMPRRIGNSDYNYSTRDPDKSWVNDKHEGFQEQLEEGRLNTKEQSEMNDFVTNYKNEVVKEKTSSHQWQEDSKPRPWETKNVAGYDPETGYKGLAKIAVTNDDAYYTKQAQQAFLRSDKGQKTEPGKALADYETALNTPVDRTNLEKWQADDLDNHLNDVYKVGNEAKLTEQIAKERYNANPREWDWFKGEHYGKTLDEQKQGVKPEDIKDRKASEKKSAEQRWLQKSPIGKQTEQGKALSDKKQAYDDCWTKDPALEKGAAQEKGNLVSQLKNEDSKLFENVGDDPELSLARDDLEYKLENATKDIKRNLAIEKYNDDAKLDWEDQKYSSSYEDALIDVTEDEVKTATQEATNKTVKEWKEGPVGQNYLKTQQQKQHQSQESPTQQQNATAAPAASKQPVNSSSPGNSASSGNNPSTPMSPLPNTQSVNSKARQTTATIETMQKQKQEQENQNQNQNEQTKQTVENQNQQSSTAP